MTHSEALTQAHPVLTTTIFDGINTRNKVLKIIQSGSDLDEVRVYKEHALFDQIMKDYEHSIKKLSRYLLNSYHKYEWGSTSSSCTVWDCVLSWSVMR